METIRRFRWAVLGAVACVACAGIGVAYGATSNEITASTQDVVLQTSAATPLPTMGGQNTTVLSVRLPAGSWVVTSDAVAVNFGANDIVRCGIYRGAVQLSGMSAEVATGHVVADIPTTGGFIRTTGSKVTLQCWHDADVAGEYIDPGATLTAHKSTSLVVQTH